MLERPLDRVENPTGGNDRPFPAGVYVGELVTPTNERVRVWPTHENARRPSGRSKQPAVASEQHTRLSLWLKATQTIEGDEEPGEQICFVDLVIADGTFSIMEVNGEEQQSGEGWQIHRDADLLANLAHAVGATEIVERGGAQYARVAEGFLDALEDGELDGTPVGFEVRHRKSKGENKKTYAYVSAFRPLT